MRWFTAPACWWTTALRSRANQILLEWDPYTFSILTEVSGVVHFKDLLDGLTLQEQVDEVTGMSQLVVMDSPDEKRQPTIVVRPEAGSTLTARSAPSARSTSCPPTPT